MATPDELNDADLLKGVVEHGSKLLAAAQRQHEQTYGRITDDPRWSFPWPLRFEIQHRYLFTASLDAFDVALGTLRQRPSQQAFAAVRFLAETLVTVRWLCEPSDATERDLRSRRVLLGSIERARKLGRHVKSDDPKAAEVIAQVGRMRDRLLEISKEDGFDHLRASPDRKWLFDKHLAEIGYGAFALLSELGSHPGPLGVMFYAMDPRSKVADVNFSGAVPERAFWASIAYESFANICEELGRVREWDSWLDEDAAALVDAAIPTLRKAVDRWGTSRGFTGDE
jgi:hypothetical protein